MANPWPGREQALGGVGSLLSLRQADNSQVIHNLWRFWWDGALVASRSNRFGSQTLAGLPSVSVLRLLTEVLSQTNNLHAIPKPTQLKALLSGRTQAETWRKVDFER